MSQRLTRKEMKQKDSFMERVGEAIEFVASHVKTLALIAVSILVIIALVVAFAGYKRGRSERADQALAAAIDLRQAAAESDGREGLSSGNQPGTDRQKIKQAFMDIQQDYPGTSAAEITNAYLGELAAREGDLEGARAAWEAFLRDQSGNILADEIEVNLMALDRAQGRGDELVTELRGRLSSGGSSLPPDLVLYQLALTLESVGRVDEANATYQRIVDEYPSSVYAAEARSRSGSTDSGFLGGA